MAINNKSYVYLSALLRAREAKMLNGEKAERILNASTFEESAKQLVDCGYPDMSGMKIKDIDECLNNRRASIFSEISLIVPDKSVVELLWEIATLVNCIENMDGNEIYDLKMFLEMYVRKFVDDEYEAEKLMELIEMKKDLYHRTVDTIMSRGESKGEARIINNLLKNGFTLDEICAMVNLEKNYVLNLLK